MMLSFPLIMIVLFVGVLIGGVGVGGVLLVPALVYLGDIPAHEAIPACMLSYVMTGVIGTLVFARHDSINWKMAATVSAGALPGAYAGAYLLPHVSAVFLEVAIAWLILASGIHALKSPVHADRQDPPSPALLVAVGLLVGAGSAMTGTGGPLLLIPVLIWLRLPILTAVGLSQGVQIPVALMATAGNLVHGAVNLDLGLIIAVVLAGGTFAGARAAHILSAGFLKKSVALLLVGVGILILAWLGIR